MADLRLRRDPVAVGGDDPFRGDLLSRKKHAEVLTLLLRIVDGPAVLSLESPWGTGKTTFVEMWSASMRQQGFPVVVFNAWETDYAADPFVALSSKITDTAGAIAGVTKSPAAQTREAAKILAKRALPGIARLATVGVLNLPDDLEAEIAKAVGTAVDDRLEAFEKATQSVTAFKVQLKSLAEGILTETDGLPLVVFVDELDRCRPTYAVELLERAKHLFSVKGVVFVLALDRQQLVNAVRAVYGQTFDAAGYLRRFIDFDCQLPPPDPEAFTKAQLAQVDLEQFFGRSTDREARQGVELMTELIVLLAPALGLSLRQIEQLVIRLGVVLRGLPNRQYTFFRATALALLLKAWRPQLYRDFVAGRERPDDLARLLEEEIGEASGLPDHQRRLIEATVLRAGRELGMSSERIKAYEELVRTGENEEDEVYNASQVLRLYELGHHSAGIGFRHVVDRIDLVADSLFTET